MTKDKRVYPLCVEDDQQRKSQIGRVLTDMVGKPVSFMIDDPAWAAEIVGTKTGEMFIIKATPIIIGAKMDQQPQTMQADCGVTFDHDPHVYKTPRGPIKACDGSVTKVRDGNTRF